MDAPFQSLKSLQLSRAHVECTRLYYAVNIARAQPGWCEYEEHHVCGGLVLSVKIEFFTFVIVIDLYFVND